MTRAALEAGKHVYSEKPLAIAAAKADELCELAEAQGLRLACAPDIFLGSAYQKARSLLDEGAIGEPLASQPRCSPVDRRYGIRTPTSSTAMGPAPARHGAVCVTAIVSLLGPVRRVVGFASTFVAERTIKVRAATG